MMNYKETLFFVAKCLTISLEEKNRNEIENQLKTKQIDWDAVVKLSTEHYVFPALYCNLKRAKFLHFLPEELVNYMIYITDLNRDRNTQIITQAKEVNQLLNDHDITPIFLKGTGNLLEGLYDDIAERMVGDIDLILSLENVKKADKRLRENKYYSSSIIFDDHRHLARLIKLNKIAAIELHKDFLKYPDRKNFNYSSVINSALKTENHFSFLGNIDKMALNIFSNQINDNGYEKGNLLLRNFYDFLLLSRKCELKDISLKYPKYKKIITSYWGVNSLLIKGFPRNEFNKSESTDYQIKKVLWILENTKLSVLYNKLKTFKINIQNRSTVFFKAFYRKSHFNFVLSRIKGLR